jgi:hypothetical protein
MAVFGLAAHPVVVPYHPSPPKPPPPSIASVSLSTLPCCGRRLAGAGGLCSVLQLKSAYGQSLNRRRLLCMR